MKAGAPWPRAEAGAGGLCGSDGLDKKENPRRVNAGGLGFVSLKPLPEEGPVSEEN